MTLTRYASFLTHSDWTQNEKVRKTATVSQKVKPNSVTTSTKMTKNKVRRRKRNCFANIAKLIMHLIGSLTIITQKSAMTQLGGKARPNAISINLAVRKHSNEQTMSMVVKLKKDLKQSKKKSRMKSKYESSSSDSSSDSE